MALELISKRFHKSVVDEVLKYFVNTDDARKYRPWVVERLLRARLLSVYELDTSLSKVCAHEASLFLFSLAGSARWQS